MTDTSMEQAQYRDDETVVEHLIKQFCADCIATKHRPLTFTLTGNSRGFMKSELGMDGKMRILSDLKTDGLDCPIHIECHTFKGELLMWDDIQDPRGEE